MIRTDAVKNIIAEKGLDGIIVTKQQNRQYLSGFTGSNAVLLFTTQDKYLLTDFRYLDQAAEETTDFSIVQSAALMEDAVADQVTRLGLKKLGFEDGSISFSEYSKYAEKMPEVVLVPLGQAIDKIRWIKDEREIEALKKAAAITDDAFDHILDFIRPGIRESEVSLELEYFMRRKGAQRAAFEIIVASGFRAALPHGVASDKEIVTGDLIVIDFGAVYDGYHADMTRTVVMGAADDKQREIYNLVLEAQEEALKAIKPQTRCADIDLVAREIIGKRGYGANFGHGLGHSVGLEIHEKPSFSPRDDTVLEPGMVLTVEPGIYLSGWGGVRIEDLVVITATGADILSKSPKHLIEL